MENENAVKQKCPKCGSDNVLITRNASSYMLESICQNCGKAWYSKGEMKKRWIIFGVSLGFALMIMLISILVVIL